MQESKQKISKLKKFILWNQFHCGDDSSYGAIVSVSR